MTTKVDGSNGVLQNYAVNTPTTGFSYTFAAGTQTLLLTPAGTLATGTVTMPPSPVDGMVITIQSTQQVTALTVSGNTGQTVVGPVTTLLANSPASYVYNLSSTTWYPFAGASGRASALSLATAVTLSAQTTVTFTGIPAWARRVKMYLNGAACATAQPIIQLGSGSLTTTGYTSGSAAAVSGANTTATGSATAGVPLGYTSATQTLTGICDFINITGNTWVGSGVLTYAASTILSVTGAIALSGALDRIALTTVAGTSAFTAGTVNVSWE